MASLRGTELTFYNLVFPYLLPVSQYFQRNKLSLQMLGAQDKYLKKKKKKQLIFFRQLFFIISSDTQPTMSAMPSNPSPQIKVFSGRYCLFQSVAPHQCPPTSISHQAFIYSSLLCVSQIL